MLVVLGSVFFADIHNIHNKIFTFDEISIQSTIISISAFQLHAFNTLRPRQNGSHFVDDIFKCIFLIENVWILIKFSQKFVPKGPINNIPALVQIMAWRRWGDKPLSEPMMISLLTYMYVTRPQWVNENNNSVEIPPIYFNNDNHIPCHTIRPWNI